MATMEREPERSLSYVIGRLDGVVDTLQDVKASLLELSRRIDQTNERIDQVNERIDKLILALVGIGGGLVITIIGGVVALGWAILRAG